MNRLALTLPLLLLTFAGCKVGPNYRRPADTTPPKWADIPADLATSQSQTLVRWWTTFNDPQLNALTERAVQANLDLKLAESRVREARAQRQVVAGSLLPELNSSGSYTHSETSGALFGTVAGTGLVPDGAGTGSGTSTGGAPVNPIAALQQRKFTIYQAGFDASWELDVFGGNRRALEAAEANESATVESRNDVLVSLLGEVARNYIDLRGEQRQLALTRATHDAQQQTYELTVAKFDAGVVSQLDVERARAQAETTNARIPVGEQQVKAAMHRLAVLLGQAPGVLEDELNPDKPIPTPAATLAIGLPSELLRRRPDIREAERTLAAATARVGVAVADLYPKFSLSGALGRQALSLSDLTLGSATYWSYGPSVRWPVFKGGQIRANIRVNKARLEQAKTQYEQTILHALEDTENAYDSYAAQRDRRPALAQAVDSNQHALDIARELYDKGLGDFLNVLDAQRNLYATQLALAENEAAISTNLVALYKAVGGGWDARP